MSSYLRNPILATLVYYDALDFPLTLIEIHKYLINPGRLTRVSSGIGEIKIDRIQEELNSLINSGFIGEKNGFYFLADRSNIYDLRIQREKISARKWKKFLRFSRLLIPVPYLRGIFASGSMALGNTVEGSDFDVLIIAKSGRLYTCRLCLWLISSLAGIRRKPSDKKAPDKLCFNHYITDKNLSIRHESLYNAQSYANLKPVMISEDMINRFYSSNLWINNFVYNFRPQKHFVRKSIVPSGLSGRIAMAGEFILDSFVGDGIEHLLKEYQQRRIAKNPVTYQTGGRVIFTDNELEFHPHSFETNILKKYKAGIGRLGIIANIEEKDSGLIPLEV